MLELPMLFEIFHHRGHSAGLQASMIERVRTACVGTSILGLLRLRATKPCVIPIAGGCLLYRDVRELPAHSRSAVASEKRSCR
jgi:hypothetical protein